MTRITTHFAITTPVPFLDVDVSTDNRLFVDPHAIRHQAPDPIAATAIQAMDSFFAEIAQCVASPATWRRERGLDLLQHFEEPWETRLGMAKNGFAGHGGAAEVGKWIWTALTTDLEALVHIGILRQLEDLPLFVEGVDRDITSDITTRLIYAALADFTGQVVSQYPEFTAAGCTVDTFDRQVWDVGRLSWSTSAVAMPVIAGRPLLLVPRDWARPTLLMSATRFYDTSVLSYAQVERAVRTQDGKLLTTRKEDLRTQPGLGRGRATNLAVTRRAHRRDEDLLARFKSFVDMRYAPLPEQEILRRTA